MQGGMTPPKAQVGSHERTHRTLRRGGPLDREKYKMYS